jgi:dihydropteroate synthase
MNTIEVRPYILQTKGRLWDLSRPQIMGILNITEDSFHSESRVNMDSAIDKAGQMLKEGATILDIGGQSTRPGSTRIGMQEEMDRVIPVIEQIVQTYPEAFVSIDTYFGRVASEAVRVGAHCINDVSAGTMDPEMWPSVAAAQVPYVLMHMQGEPGTMQKDPQYDHVTRDVFAFLSEKIQALRQLGVKDILIDPGFGFGKRSEHNYQLMRELSVLHGLDVPILVGVSRKKMIQHITETDAAGALNGTTAMHMIALMQGARLLRVHDVWAAKEVIRVYEAVTNRI